MRLRISHALCWSFMIHAPVCPILASSARDEDLFAYIHSLGFSSVKPLRRMTRLPRESPRRIPKHQSGLSLHTCSSARTGENELKTRTLMPASVSCFRSSKSSRQYLDICVISLCYVFYLYRRDRKAIRSKVERVGRIREEGLFFVGYIRVICPDC